VAKPGVAVIGAGYWGKNLVRNMAQLERLVAVCDASEAVRARISVAHPSVRVTADIQDVLDDPAVGAVMVVVPSSKHYEVARRALLAGKHTYVEKPIAHDVAKAEDLVALAEAADVQLMVGHLLLYHPCITWMKDAIDAGELGRVLYMTCERVNLGKVRSDENAMWSLAPHDVSVILHLLGDTPTEVAAHGLTYLQQQAGIEDVVFLTLRYADGRAAHIHVSWLDPHKRRRFTVVGSRKMVTFDDMKAEKIRVFDKGVEGLDEAPDYASYGDLLTLRQGDIHSPHVPMREPLRVLCQSFLDAIDHGTTPLTDGRNGVDVLRVLMAGQRSLEAGGAPMPLDTP
jgi:predicted dehydrogenase